MNKAPTVEEVSSLTEAQAALALVEMARADIKQGKTISSGDFKERLKRKKEALKK